MPIFHSLGGVMAHHRKRCKHTVSEMAELLEMDEDQLHSIETGKNPIEHWGLLIAALATVYQTPTRSLLSREVAQYRTFESTRGVPVGPIMKDVRVAKGMTLAAVAKQVEVPIEEVQAIEAGETPVEHYGPMLLHFAEIVEEPIFNLFYPGHKLYRRHLSQWTDPKMASANPNPITIIEV